MIEKSEWRERRKEHKLIPTQRLRLTFTTMGDWKMAYCIDRNNDKRGTYLRHAVRGGKMMQINTNQKTICK